MKTLAAMGSALALVLLTAAAAAAQTLSPADTLEIQRLYASYNYAFDSADGDMFATVFSEDGEFETGGRTTKGVAALKAMASRGTKRERPKIFHITTNVLITPTADGAKGSAYVMTVDLSRENVISGGGVYEDAFVKTPQGWKLKKRVFFGEPRPATAPR
jgi:hypothetical protein